MGAKLKAWILHGAAERLATAELCAMPSLFRFFSLAFVASVAASNSWKAPDAGALMAASMLPSACASEPLASGHSTRNLTEGRLTLLFSKGLVTAHVPFDFAIVDMLISACIGFRAAVLLADVAWRGLASTTTDEVLVVARGVEALAYQTLAPEGAGARLASRIATVAGGEVVVYDGLGESRVADHLLDITSHCAFVMASSLPSSGWTAAVVQALDSAFQDWLWAVYYAQTLAAFEACIPLLFQNGVGISGGGEFWCPTPAAGGPRLNMRFVFEGGEQFRFGYLHRLLERARDKLALDTVRLLEVGVHEAATAGYVLARLPSLEYVGVDPYTTYADMPESTTEQSARYERALGVLGTFGARAQLFRSTLRDLPHSPAAAGFFHGVFLDGSHYLRHIVDDFEELRDVLSDGGFLSGHDFSAFYLDVMLAVFLECQSRSASQASLGRDATWWFDA